MNGPDPKKLDALRTALLRVRQADEARDATRVAPPSLLNPNPAPSNGPTIGPHFRGILWEALDRHAPAAYDALRGVQRAVRPPTKGDPFAAAAALAGLNDPLSAIGGPAKAMAGPLSRVGRVGMEKIDDIANLRRVMGGGDDLFIRWSRGEKLDRARGVSRDYQGGGTHNGLSAVKVDPEWGPAYQLRRLKEYGFLRMKDPKIRPYIYRGRQVGKDTDGYPTIEILETRATIGDDMLRAMDEGLMDVAEAMEVMEDAESRLKVITDPAGRAYVQQRATEARGKVEQLLNERPGLRRFFERPNQPR